MLHQYCIHFHVDINCTYYVVLHADNVVMVHIHHFGILDNLWSACLARGGDWEEMLCL